MSSAVAVDFVHGFKAALADDKSREELRLVLGEYGFLGGVYSDMEIKQAVARGDFIIDPYNEENIQGTSVDVSLGEHFYVVDRVENQPAYNPWNETDVKRYFEKKEAMTHQEWSKRHKNLYFEGIPDDQPLIVLWPRERILSHTPEFIGPVEGVNATTQMLAKSTTGRNGIVVCKDAGWGDPGYCNRWTMEIQNDNDEAVPLLVGATIAQMVFYHCGPVEHFYGSRGKYQAPQDPEQLKKSWKPEHMLPKGHKDLKRMAKFRILA